jgi:AraC-like DNA-binding protein
MGIVDRTESPTRPPKPALRPFVDLLWAADGAGVSCAASGRELVLPTGAVHIVFRLSDHPLRVFTDRGDAVGDVVGCAVIGGARARPYLRDVSVSGPSVGALLRPGAAELMIGAPARAFSHVHTRLEDVWGAKVVAEIREKLREARSASHRLDVFEAALAARLPRVRGINPLVAHALARFGASCRVGEVVRECGYSHRYFTTVFRETVGLKPKTYCRLLRFGRVLDRLTAEPGIGWADLAAAEGYADQPHLNREFLEFGGLSPGCYRQRAPIFPRHVPV